MEAAFRSIVDHLPELVTVTDPKGTVLFLNRTACRLLGISNGGNQKTLSVASLFSEPFCGEIQTRGIEEAGRNGICENGAAMLARDGRIIPVMQKIIANRDTNGNIDSFCFVAQLHSAAEENDKTAIPEENEPSGTLAARLSERLATGMTQVLSAMRDAVIVLSPDAEPILTNPAAIRMLGGDPAGKPMEIIIENLHLKHADGRPLIYNEMPVKRAFLGETVNSEQFRFIDSNNRMLTYSISSFPLFHDGEIMGVVCVARDNTRKEELMLRLEQERSALQAIIRSAPETILVVDENCRIVMSNPEAERLYGKPIPHGQSYETHTDLKMLYPDGKTDDPIDQPLSRTVFHGEVIEDLEMDIALPDGNLRHVLVNTSPILNPQGTITGGVGIFHDITTRKREKLELQRIRGELEKRVRLRTMELSHTVDALKAEIDERIRIEKKLRNSQAKLREMSKRMLHALEADRQSVAKDLHDSIGASLAAIKFSLEEKLSRMTETPPTDIISLEQVVSYLMSTIKETKRISANLRPTTLDDLGLIPTISWFCREYKAFYKQIEVNQYIDIDESQISDSMKIVIYRIMQEAMNNAAKHGAPNSIDLTLSKTDGHVVLSLEDNGVGFEPDTGLISEDPLSGHGVQGMRERAEICGGMFCLESHPGKGTRITVSLPAETCA